MILSQSLSPDSEPPNKNPKMSDSSSDDDSRFEKIPVTEITMGQSQARNRKVDKNLDDLVESIKKHGLIEPVIVYENSTGKYTLFAGQRRFLAVKRIGWENIDAMVRPKPSTILKEKTISYVENVMREDMVRQDVVDACKAFIMEYRTIKAVAEELGIKPDKVRDYLAFDALPEELQVRVHKKDFTLNTALKAAKALTWDHKGFGKGEVESDDKVIELAEKMKDLAAPQQDMVVKIGSADPSRPIDEIIGKAKKRKGKKVTFEALEEDYTRLSTFSSKEKFDTIGEAAYELTKDALDRSGY